MQLRTRCLVRGEKNLSLSGRTTFHFELVPSRRVNGSGRVNFSLSCRNLFFYSIFLKGKNLYKKLSTVFVSFTIFLLN